MVVSPTRITSALTTRHHSRRLIDAVGVWLRRGRRRDPAARAQARPAGRRAARAARRPAGARRLGARRLRSRGAAPRRARAPGLGAGARGARRARRRLAPVAVPRSASAPLGADTAGDVAGRVERRVVPRAPARRQDRLLGGAARDLVHLLRAELADRLGAQLQLLELVHAFSPRVSRRYEL